MFQYVLLQLIRARVAGLLRQQHWLVLPSILVVQLQQSGVCVYVYVCRSVWTILSE